MNRPVEGWIFWDFDGTLAHRKTGWSECMATVIAKHYPQMQVTVDSIRPHFSSGFPWHRPEVAHLDLVDPEAWWAALRAHVATMLEQIGCHDHEEHGLFADFRTSYIDSDAFELLPGTAQVLDALARRGWRQLILSNHVPELPNIVHALGLDEHIERVVTSANIGYEKPHPQAYQIALQVAGSPRQVWMIGDNLIADVQGANAAGLASILVGGAPNRWPHATPDLQGIIDLVGSPPG
ncbi:MAG: HAD-IA family hydrolase [Ilumatobacteraceae bacterium]